MFKENLRDVLKHSYALGFLDFVKLEGDKVKAISDDKSVCLRATMATPFAELKEQKVGLSNMSILKGYLEFPPFQLPGSTVEVEYAENKDGEYPRNIIFKSVYNHNSSYTFMSATNADKKVQVPLVDVDKYVDVVFEVDKKNLKDIVYFSGLLSKFNTVFKIQIRKSTVEFVLGDENSSKSEIPIATDVKGKISNDMYFPLAQVLQILKLADSESCTIGIYDGIGMLITVKSEYGTYNYSLQARKKKI